MPKISFRVNKKVEQQKITNLLSLSGLGSDFQDSFSAYLLRRNGFRNSLGYIPMCYCR